MHLQRGRYVDSKGYVRRSFFFFSPPEGLTNFPPEIALVVWSSLLGTLVTRFQRERGLEMPLVCEKVPYLF